VRPQKDFLHCGLGRTKNIRADNVDNYPRLSLARNKVNPGLTSIEPG